MKVKTTLVDFCLVAFVAVAAVLALATVVAVVMGGIDGHKTAGWSWDKHPTAGTVIVLAPDDGMADGNG